MEFLRKISESYHINCKFENIPSKDYDILFFLNEKEFDYKFLESIFNDNNNQEIIVANTKFMREFLLKCNCDENYLKLNLCNKNTIDKILYNSMLTSWNDKTTKNVSNLISQLMRLFATPSEIFLLKPEQMQNMQKDVAVIGGVLPLLTKKNQSVLSDLGDLKDLKIEITAHQEKLLKMTQKLAGDREELANLLAVKKQKYQMKETELSQITKSQEELAKSASDMKDLIEKLSRQQSKKLAKKTIKTKDKIVAKIKTILPVAGKIKIGYGEINELGAENKGVIISARPGAQVVAPYTGKVLFAGNFANYKELVIIAHKDGYHSVVAGMGKIIARVGSQVMQGEPIGVALDGADRSDVYYELRLNGSAIRPLL